MQTQTINQTYELPAEAAKFLRSLESRNLSLSIQKKKSEVGDWRDEFQIRGGAIFGADWEKLNRFRRHFVRYCEERNLVDEAFSDVSREVIPMRERGDRAETVVDMCRRAAANLKSDEKARHSRVEAQEAIRREKEAARREKGQEQTTLATMVCKRWGKSQDDWLIANYHKNNVWPHAGSPTRCRPKRKEKIMVELAKLGPDRTWLGISHRVGILKAKGVLKHKKAAR